MLVDTNCDNRNESEVEPTAQQVENTEHTTPGSNQIDQEIDNNIEEQSEDVVDNSEDVEDTYQSPVQLTYQQRKLLKYEQETLKSFGGGLGDIVFKPRLSQIEREKKVLTETKISENPTVNRRRKLLDSHSAGFEGSLDSTFAKKSPKSMG